MSSALASSVSAAAEVAALAHGQRQPVERAERDLERPTCSPSSWARSKEILGLVPIAQAPGEHPAHHVWKAELAVQPLPLGQARAGVGARSSSSQSALSAASCPSDA